MQTMLCSLTHRQKVREEIAKDRAERAARAKAESEASSVASQPSQPSAPQPKKEYDTCRLQVGMHAHSVAKYFGQKIERLT